VKWSPAQYLKSIFRGSCVDRTEIVVRKEVELNAHLVIPYPDSDERRVRVTLPAWHIYFYSYCVSYSSFYVAIL